MAFFRVKEDVAFLAIRGKKCFISRKIEHTTDGVVVQICGESGGGYKYRLRDLEPY